MAVDFLSPDKETTPVQPCLDYRCLNECLQSEPGLDAVVCQDTLRKWRLAGDVRNHKLLDIRKAYLNVRVAPELLRYQTVVWKGAVYVMTRMGFGLSIAPKFMDIIAPLAVGQGGPQAIIRCMYVCHAGHYEGLRGAEQMSACG